MFCRFSQAQAPPKKGSSSSTERTLDGSTQFGTYDPFSTPEPPTTPSNEPGKHFFFLSFFLSLFFNEISKGRRGLVGLFVNKSADGAKGLGIESP